MALPSITQQISGNTTTAAPASATATFAATAAGSGLVLFAAAAISGVPTVTPPAGWKSGPSIVQGTTLALYCFYLPNNPGGVTTVLLTLASVNGIAWVGFEVPNLNTLFPQDANSGATLSSASATSIGPASYQPLMTDEIWFAVCGCISTGTITRASTGGRTAPWTSNGAATSTTGATNASIAADTQLQGAAPLVAAASYTIAPAAACAALIVCFYSTSSKQVNLLEGGVYAVPSP